MEIEEEDFAHLKEDDSVDIEMSEVMPNKDIKMANDVRTDGMKIFKETEIAINGNDEDRDLLNLVKQNLFLITHFDDIMEKIGDNPSELISFLERSKNLMILNSSHGIASTFNRIIHDKFYK